MAIVKAFDTSRHNHPITREYPDGAPIDFAQAYADGYRIHSPRASVGNYYIDPWFARDFDAGRAAGFIEAPYHVIAPEYPDAPQVAKFVQALDGRKPDGIVIDMELSRDQTPARITQSNRYHALQFQEMTPGRVIEYTNASFANTYLLSHFDLPLFVANPGDGGGMNYNPKPYLPRLWTDYIAWQKSWKQAIPGVPDTTTDYTEFQMSEAEARAFFEMESEEDMTEITEKLDLILSNLGMIWEKLNSGGGEEPPVVPPVVPPPPVEPDHKYYVKVTAPDKTNARFQYGKNAKGKPIFQIYPGDSSKANERIQYANGKLLEVYPEKIDGDSDIDCYELVGRMAGDGKQLYAWTKEVMKTW